MKFGSDEGLTYSNNAESAIELEPIYVEGRTLLTFYYWIDAELDRRDATKAWDGGIVEASVNDGDWERVGPVSGGYTLKEKFNFFARMGTDEFYMVFFQDLNQVVLGRSHRRSSISLFDIFLDT